MRDNRWKEDDSRMWDEGSPNPNNRDYGQRGRNEPGRNRDDDRAGPYGRGGQGGDLDRDRGGRYGQGRYDADPDFGRRSIGGGPGYGQGYGQADYDPPGYGAAAYGQSGAYRPDDRGVDYGGRDRGYGGSGYGGSGYGGNGYGGSAGYGAPDYGGHGRSSYRAGPGFRDDGRYGRGERGWWDRATDEVASWMGDEDAERRRAMDDARSHQGRGPRGYTRSDDRIREDVNDRLTDDHRVDAADVDVSVSGGEVTLNGTVRSRDEKRRAEDVAESVSGVKHVQNNLRMKEASGDEGNRGLPGTSGTAAASGVGAAGMTATKPMTTAVPGARSPN